ncbi:TPA: energy-coupling factor ABC transporter ATP-binding protein, partial [Candidatus Bathyarchaeota archaeon]|nr:energy-coupling factor ABC transporter ATP-binding protein [Candidatus Bathyarchaeota archaeon]
GLVFQNPDHQFFCESVEDEIRFALENFGFERRAIEERTRWALEFFGLAAYRRRSPFLLSGGEKKRLAMASILVWGPKYVVLDEPTIGQDYDQKQRLIRLLRRLREEGKTIVLTTHDVEFAADCGQRVVLMKGGRILADGDVGSVLTDPALLKEASILPPQVTQISLALSDVGFPKVYDVSEARRAIITYVREGHWPS